MPLENEVRNRQHSRLLGQTRTALAVDEARALAVGPQDRMRGGTVLVRRVANNDRARTIAARGYRRIVTVEDGVKKGGLGSAVLEYYAAVRSADPTKEIPSVTILGLPDHFVTHGPVPQLQKDCGIDTESIIAAIKM